MDPNVSIPETWAEHSNRNIQESQSSTTFVTYTLIFSIFPYRPRSKIFEWFNHLQKVLIMIVLLSRVE